MTVLDLTRPHIVTAPHQIYGSGMWFAWCTCGEEFSGTTADAARDAGKPHRDAERNRLSKVEQEAADVG